MVNRGASEARSSPVILLESGSALIGYWSIINCGIINSRFSSVAAPVDRSDRSANRTANANSCNLRHPPAHNHFPREDEGSELAWGWKKKIPRVDNLFISPMGEILIRSIPAFIRTLIVRGDPGFSTLCAGRRRLPFPHLRPRLISPFFSFYPNLNILRWRRCDMFICDSGVFDRFGLLIPRGYKTKYHAFFVLFSVEHLVYGDPIVILPFHTRHNPEIFLVVIIISRMYCFPHSHLIWMHC